MPTGPGSVFFLLLSSRVSIPCSLRLAHSIQEFIFMFNNKSQDAAAVRQELGMPGATAVASLESEQKTLGRHQTKAKSNAKGSPSKMAAA